MGDTTGVAHVRLMKRHHVVALLAVLLAVVGGVGSVLGADAITHSNAEKSQQSFKSSSDEVASTLQLAIRQEDDLVVDTSGFLAGNSTASNAQFAQWVKSVRAMARYPELASIGYSVIVLAADLPAFAARAAIDPAGRLAAGGTLQVEPPGNRPFYCLSAGAVSRNKASELPAGIDYCASGAKGVAPLTLRDSGQSGYEPLPDGNVSLLGILTPVYQGGVIPTTVAGRRSAFIGWVGTLTNPQVVIARALQGHPQTAVTMSYHAFSSNAVFSSGKAPVGAQSTMISLHNGWTVTTFAVVAGGGVFTDGSALAVLLIGIVLSLLLAMLVFVLATGRARALRLVGERTGELRHQALHDSLTGLPNRALIMDRIEQLLARNRRQGTSGAALYVDLDNFKDVNDTLGHAAGDRLLVSVAARLESALRNADTIGRMGGDEFVVLIDGASLEAAPELVADRLLNVMRRPFDLDGATMPLVVNASVGIAMGDRTDPGDLLRDADVALYEAKAAGKNRYAIFHAEMQTEISRRTELEFALRSALECSQFRLVYQPIYNLDDLTLVGVEALLRWQHPTEGLMQPDDFIPILEQTGQIREVGHWVLVEACRQMAVWHTRGDTLDVSVNVSGRQLDSDDIVSHVRNALDVSNLDPTSLIVEVTETALMRNAEATAVRLAAIKSMGVKIAVDDFGTGYSSLAYLRQFPVDCLKIDRMFTHAITTSPESKALIGTLVQLGRDLGLRTLAEGVETIDEMDHLRDEHVDEAQGFLLARPLDAETLEAQLLLPGRPTAFDVPHPSS
jgi:diguanylate cyclase (GGDEF)-like protein